MGSKSRRPVWVWVIVGLLTGVVLFVGLVALVGVAGFVVSPDPPSATTAVAVPESASATPAPLPSPTGAPPTASNLPPPPVTLSPSPMIGSGQLVRVTRIVDGDTIETEVGRIRLIGIDTPERSECNYRTATDELRAMIDAAGGQVVLTPGAQDDRDRYDRLLRYVDTPTGEDLNLHMIASGFAIARYDSRDGYGRHTREDAYVAADTAAAEQPCG